VSLERAKEDWAIEKISVDVSEAQTHLWELLDRINAGARIILNENDKPQDINRLIIVLT
jgi:hypothetical protein